jgi:hypothetical protein
MRELLIGTVLWIGLDVVLLTLWLAVGRRHKRRHAQATVRAVAQYANGPAARSLVAALNSGHAEDAEIRHARPRPQGRQGEPKPL